MSARLASACMARLTTVTLQGVRKRSVAAGAFTSLAVTTDGEACGWGQGADHNMELRPVFVHELTENQLSPLKYPGLCLHA